MDKKSLSERDICSKYIAPSVQRAGWDMHRQVREEVSFTKGRIIVRAKLHSRGESPLADFILHHQPNLPLAVIEAKANKLSVGSGTREPLGYKERREQMNILRIIFHLTQNELDLANKKTRLKLMRQ